MGAGEVGLLFWGAPIPDDRADLAYGLADRTQERHTKMPEDRPEPKTPGMWVHRPRDWQSGRHWIGVLLEELPALPKPMRERVHAAVEANEMVDVPHVDSGRLGSAKALWAHFADWCSRRGWTPPEPGLYVVADYD